MTPTSLIYAPMITDITDPILISLDCPVTFISPAISSTEKGGKNGADFTAIATQINLIAAPQDCLENCLLTLSISSEQYEQILEQALFNLKPEIRGPLQQRGFWPERPILLELRLDTRCLAPLWQTLVDNATSYGEVSEALVSELTMILRRGDVATATQISPQALIKSLLIPPTSLEDSPPWMHTERWYCQSAQQQQAEGTVGYTTLWAYTSPEYVTPLIDSAMDSGAEALDAISSFLEKSSTAVKTEFQNELPHLQTSLSQLSDQLATALEQVDWEAIATEPEPDFPPVLSTPLPVFTVVKQFFDQDNWAYVQLSDATALQLAFQGDVGRWTCLAQCDDADAQVVFYSICPLIVSPEYYGKVAEFLMRANDGLIVGNFELNYETGEIRYKTSLDVEGDRLTPALMENLVYVNVQTLDTYLPGIMAVLENRYSPAEAIELVESD